MILGNMCLSSQIAAEKWMQRKSVLIYSPAPSSPKPPTPPPHLCLVSTFPLPWVSLVRTEARELSGLEKTFSAARPLRVSPFSLFYR